MSQMKPPLVLMALAFPLLKSSLFWGNHQGSSGESGHCSHLEISEVDNQINFGQTWFVLS